MGRDIAERQHDCSSLYLQGEIEQPRILYHAPCDETDTDTRIARGIQFVRKPCFVAITAAEYPETARVADRDGELCIRDRRHRGGHDRMLNSQEFCKSRRNRHLTL